MPINNAQLIISPVIRQYFTDPTTLLPVVGTIEFFKIDKITPKNVYQQTGDLENPFEVAANPITLDAAGAIPFVLYLYPYDENDEEIEELYYIEVRRTDNSLVFALDNFPENFSADNSNVIDDDLINKCPSYGFDNPVLGNHYTEMTKNKLTLPWASDLENGARPAQGWLWQLQNVSNSQFYYEVISIPSDTFPGNPLYTLTLYTGTTIEIQNQNLFGFRLCAGNELKDVIINWQFFCQDNLANTTNLDVYVFNGDVTNDTSTKVNVGNITIDTNYNFRTISFTMPDLSGVLVEQNSPTWLFVELPLDSQFSLSFTGEYVYFGDNLTINRLPLSYGISQSRQMLSNPEKDIYNSDTYYNSSDLPLVNRKGRLSYLSETGKIFTASSTFDVSNANANALDDTTLIRGDNINGVITDRFLDKTNLSKFGGNTFVISNISGSSFDITTQDIAPSFSEWESFTAAITITANDNSGGQLTAVVDGGNPNKVDVTFNNDFDANTLQRWDIKEDNGGSNFIAYGSGYQTRVINNVVGSYVSGSTVNYVTNLNFNVNSNITITNTQTGSPSTPAECSIEFSPTGFPSVTQIRSTTKSFQLIAPYNIILYENYLAFLQTSSNSMPNPPPYAVQFNVDDEGENIRSSLKTIVVNLDSALINNGNYLAATLAAALSGGNIYTIDVVSVPSNGDYFTMSTSNKTINVVMFETTQTKPNKPNDNISTIFVPFLSSQSTSDISSAIASTIHTDTGSIPTQLDLNLSILPEELLYYVNL